LFLVSVILGNGNICPTRRAQFIPVNFFGHVSTKSNITAIARVIHVATLAVGGEFDSVDARSNFAAPAYIVVIGPACFGGFEVAPLHPFGILRAF
jgi:hypothetical protein